MATDLSQFTTAQRFEMISDLSDALVCIHKVNRRLWTLDSAMLQVRDLLNELLESV